MKLVFRQIAPTPARGKLTDDLWEDKDWWAEEKLDGDRRIAQFMKASVRFTGRRVSDVDGLYVEKTENLPHLNCAPPKALRGCVLDGELVCPWPGARSKDVTSIMGSKPDLAKRKQEERGYLQYHVFDCLFWEGEDVRGQPLHLRRKLLEKAVTAWGNAHVRMVRRELADTRQFLADIWAAGGEGVILKDQFSPYNAEKQWVKVKKVDSEDVVIMGYEDAKAESTKVSGITSATKYAAKGWIGAVKFGQYKDGKLVDCGKCSGMSDRDREMFSTKGHKYIGQVMEILANEREETGKFRHPRFVGLRFDKNPKDCVWGKK